MKTFFISSTFKDMQAERDMLHKQIFPRLRTLTKSFGEDIQEVDLRWGVDTVNMSEEESGHEVLKICIDAIDRCKPYMIVLVGERYGWIPGKPMVDTVRDQRISDRYEQEMSITELEIQYGALLNDDTFEKCIFCFRDPGVIDKIDADHQMYYRPESPLHAQRLAMLKNKIRAREGAMILEYSADWDAENHVLCGLDPFAQQLYLHLEALIRRDFEGQRPKSLMEQQASEITLMKDSFLTSYVRRYPEEFWITKHIAAFQRDIVVHNGLRQTDCLLVSGGAGSGKSALMAYMASCTPQMQGKTILCFAAASGCKDIPSLKRYLAYSLETVLSEPHNADPSSVDQYLRTLDKKAEKQGIICFVDGLDQIYQGQKDPYLDLPALCPNLFWVFSALPDFPFAQAAVDYTYHTVQVEGLHPAQRAELIASTAAKRGKKLDDELIGMITNSKGAHNPLFLSLVLQRLFMMSKTEFEAAEALAPGMEGLHRYMQELLVQMPDTPDRMASYILDVTARLFEQAQFSEILMLIACSYNGLTEKELEGLLALEGVPFTPVKFQQIVSYLYDAFAQNSNGKWNFYHRLFGEAVRSLMTEDDRVRIGKLLADYALADPDFLQQEGFRYLLAQKHRGFAGVLEAAITWQTRAEVYTLVGISAREDASIREFLTELVLANPTEEMAGYWLGFEDFHYGKNVQDMCAKIYRNLLDGPVSDAKKWQLALACTYYAEKEELLPLLTRAENHVQSLQEPERTIATASVQADKARSLTALHKPYSEIRLVRDNSLACIDRGMELLHGQGPWKSYITLLDSLYTVGNNAVGWEDPEADKIWLHALELLESIGHFAKEQEDDYIYYNVLFLSELCYAYSVVPWRDYDKATQFGDHALELAEIAASQRPTMRNLKNKFNALTTYVRRLKDEYTCSYRREIVDCARRIYAVQKSDRNKRQLAEAESEYGLAYLKAVKANVERYQLELNKEAIQYLDHSAALFEELIESNYAHNQMAAYASILADRVELYCDHPDKALSCGHRSLALLYQRQQEVQKLYDSEPSADARKYYARQLDWCIGWTCRVKSTMANIYLEQLDLENSLRYAQEGLPLSQLSAKRAPAYVTEVLTCALIIAQSSYYLRRDQEALAACDEAQILLDEANAQGSSREPYDAELLYIRSRIALEHGDVETAWKLCQECLSRKKTQLLSNKALILKADCLQAMGDPQSDDAWGEALKVWRKELATESKAFHSVSQYIHSLNKKPAEIKIKWRTYSRFTLPAYYMAYCYHHYVNSRRRVYDYYDEFERKVLLALYYQGKGYLKGRLPYGMNEQILDVSSGKEIPDCGDFSSFVTAMDDMANYHGSHVDPAVCQLILDNIDRFPEAVPDREQYNILYNIARILYDQLLEERRELYSNKQECDLLQKLFQLDNAYPVHKFTPEYSGDICVIWPREYAESSSDPWYALLKLLLLLLRRESVLNTKIISKLLSTYRIVSEQIGGSEKIEKADNHFLSAIELEVLLSSYTQERELRIKFSNTYWYAMKNVWTAELYRRSMDPVHITHRIQELQEFLSEPYTSLYQQLDFRDKKGMPTEIINAVMHLVQALNERDGAQMTIPVIRWAESLPELSGRLDSKTLYSVQAFNEADSLWVEELKLRYCIKWMENSNVSLSSIRLV